MVILDRLRKAVKRLTFLLNLKAYIALTQSTLRFASLIRNRAPASIAGRRWGRRAISFNDRPGLRDCVIINDHGHADNNLQGQDQYSDGETTTYTDIENGIYVRNESGSPSSVISSPSPRTLSRTTSYPFEEDVDRQADMFIDNFYRHLILEKQVSLNLRYCRDTSFGSSNESVLSPLY